jgi:hypothetical protein
VYTEFETPKRKRPLGISRRRWEDDIKIDLKLNEGRLMGLYGSEVGTSGWLL